MKAAAICFAMSLPLMDLANVHPTSFYYTATT